MLKNLFTLLLAAMSYGVAAAPAMTLELIGDRNFPHWETVAQTPFNGLSALVYDREEQRFFVLSDDRSQYAPARLYMVAGQVGPGVEIVPQAVIFLHDANGEFFLKNTVDFEGVTLLANDHLLVSSEGVASQGISPALIEFSRDGRFVRQWPVPGQFTVTAQTGVRDNLGFESLTITPDGSHVFTANEQALQQDGETATLTHGTPVRIVKYSGSGRLLGQYPYMVSALPHPSDHKHVEGGNGLVELLALDEHTLLSLERSWMKTTGEVSIRLFHVRLQGATNIAGLPALDGNEQAIVYAHKTLVLDLKELLPLPDEAFPDLDNLEGMAFGPRLPDGGTTLFLVSDGNFNEKQRTLFLAFRLDNGNKQR